MVLSWVSMMKGCGNYSNSRFGMYSSSVSYCVWVKLLLEVGRLFVLNCWFVMGLMVNIMFIRLMKMVI